MKVTKQETLYHEDHGATLKHKCGKRIVASPLLSFSLIFLFGLSSFYGLSLFFYFSFFGPSPFYGLSLLFLFLTWDNALENDDHHTSIYLQLNDYNSVLEQSMTLYECLRWCTGIAMNQEWHVWKNYERWLCHKYDVNYMIMQSNMTMMNVSW